jgi:glycosyltransferase involved in cell wall biosynthesis
LKIAFDAKRAFLNNSGLGNYARTIIKNLYSLSPDLKQYLYTPTFRVNDFYKEVSILQNVSINKPTGLFANIFSSYWRSCTITKELIEKKIDVYHGLSNELPINIKQFKGKKIVTIHDLIFLRYPHLYPLLDRLIYRRKFYAACKHADVIIAISEETKKDIILYFNIPAQKIKVIYQSCDDSFYKNYTENEIQDVKNTHQLPTSYLLYVGTIEKRKNLLTIIKSLKQVKEIALIVIGKKTEYFNEIEQFISQNELNNRVLFLENVTNSQLPIIYQNASVFIYPSIFEGFGIPIIEALISKTPVITNKNGCFPEAGGPNSIYIDPLNETLLADKINELLNSEKLRNEIADKGYIYAEKFHKVKITKQLIEIYESNL